MPIRGGIPDLRNPVFVERVFIHISLMYDDALTVRLRQVFIELPERKIA